MLNYNKIISLNQQFAENHYGIKRFGNGQVFDLVLDNQEAPMRYPVMWMEDLPSPIETGLEHFAFRVWFLAQVEQLENRDDDDILVNANEVKSDMKQLGIDFLSYWKQDSNYKDELRFEITTTWNYAELVQPDELTGGYFDVAFKVKQMFNRCIVPMGTITPPENSCLPVNFLIDGVQSEVIQSGTDFDLTVENQDGNTPDYEYNSATDTLTVQTGGGDTPVDITVNGTLVFNQVTTNQTLSVENTNGVQKGSLVAGDWQLPDVAWTDSDLTPQTTPYGDPIVCTPPSAGLEQIGSIDLVDFSTALNLNDFTTVSTGTVTYTLDAGFLKVTGTPASVSPITTFAKHIHSIALENYNLRFKVDVKTYTNANESIVFGIEADQPFSTVRKELFYWFRNTGVAASTGKIFRQINNGVGAVFVNTAVAPVIGHTYEINMAVRFNSIRVNIKDITPGFENEQGESISFTYANTASTLTPRSSRLFIGTGGGEHWFRDFEISSMDLRRGDHLVVHDSLGDGYCTDHLVQRWLDIQKVNHPAKVIMKSGRQGDYPAHAALRGPEFTILKGSSTTVHLHIGTNQVVALGAAPAFVSYQALINLLISLGYTTFVHYYAFPRGGSTQINTYNGLILSTYGALAGHTVVDTNTPFNDGSNNLLALYAAADNVHLNAGPGQRKMAELTSQYFA